MNRKNIFVTPSLFLGEREREGERDWVLPKRLERKKEKFVMLRNKFFKTRCGALGAILGALVLLLVAVLVACPAANNGGGGSQYRYTCANGTGADATFDASADGLSRCVSCNGGYTLLNEVCLTAYDYVCLNGTPSSLDATVDGLTRCASCNLLYRLDGTTDVVGTSCGQVAIGEATRIGMATEFGVGEGFPYDLAAIGSILYMAGGGTVALYTLDTTTGRATQVGSTTNFGVSEGFPVGLTAIGTTLYMTGAVTDALYTLDTTTGVATRESDASVDQFGVSEGEPRGLAAISGTLYMVGQSNDVLYTLNIDSADGSPDGMAYRVGSMTNLFGEGENNPTGLAAIGTTLYMVGFDNDVLYSLNTTTGVATQVGSATAGFGVSEIQPSGLGATSTTLYMVGGATDALHALRYQ